MAVRSVTAGSGGVGVGVQDRGILQQRGGEAGSVPAAAVTAARACSCLRFVFRTGRKLSSRACRFACTGSVEAT